MRTHSNQASKMHYILVLFLASAIPSVLTEDPSPEPHQPSRKVKREPLLGQFLQKPNFAAKFAPPGPPGNAFPTINQQYDQNGGYVYAPSYAPAPNFHSVSTSFASSNTGNFIVSNPGLYPQTPQYQGNYGYPQQPPQSFPVQKPLPPQVIRVPVPVPRPVPVPVERKVPVKVPVYIRVPQPVRVEVPVPKPYPVTVEKKVPVPYPVKVPVYIRVPVSVPTNDGNYGQGHVDHIDIHHSNGFENGGGSISVGSIGGGGWSSSTTNNLGDGVVTNAVPDCAPNGHFDDSFNSGISSGSIGQISQSSSSSTSFEGVPPQIQGAPVYGPPNFQPNEGFNAPGVVKK